mgnify:CR=1 FL=1
MLFRSPRNQVWCVSQRIAVPGARCRKDWIDAVPTSASWVSIMMSQRQPWRARKSRHQATVSAQTGGRIAAVYYDVDDFVEACSELVRFTDVEQATALRQAEAHDPELPLLKSVRASLLALERPADANG